MDTSIQKGLLKMVRNPLDTGVTQTFVASNVLFDLLPFKQNEGAMTYTYTRVNEMLEGVVRELGENVTGGAIEPETVHELLQIISNDVVLDRMYVDGHIGNVIDIKVENTQNAAIGLANMFCKQFYYGTGIKQMKGLKQRLESSEAGVKLSELTLDNIGEAIDTVSYSNVGTKVLVMNAKTKRQVDKLVKAEGFTLTNIDVAGKSLVSYDGVPIVVDANVNDGEVFAMNLSDTDGITGVTLKGITASEQGYEGTAYRIGIEGAFGLAVKHPKSFVHIVPAGRSK